MDVTVTVTWDPDQEYIMNSKLTLNIEGEGFAGVDISDFDTNYEEEQAQIQNGISGKTKDQQKGEQNNQTTDSAFKYAFFENLFEVFDPEKKV